ncbi:MAG: hypothetical protein WC776_05275 [Patescibacteria group bacterium]|jgi:hypothetical protein
MKIELFETNEIKIIPETLQDKVWLTLFMRDASDNQFCKRHMELSFEKGSDADHRTSGYADPKKVGAFYERKGAEIDFSEISGLTIYNHNI